MKIKGIFEVKNISEDVVAVPTDGSRKIVKLNQSGVVLWNILTEETTIDDLTKAILEEYEIDEYTAKADVEAFIEKLRDADLLDE